MRCIKTSLIAGAAALTIAAPAGAADMPPPMVYKAPVAVQTGGWYLRGDIGFSNQKIDEVTSPAFTPSVTVLSKGVDAAPFGGLGFGYTFNNWFRVDVTGEYRGGANVRVLDTYGAGSNDYFGTKSEWLFLGNAYIDLGTWWCFTPFIGAGIGASRNTIHDFRDIGTAPGIASVAYGQDTSKWNFAWAVYAGVGYQVTPNVTLELAYRYVDLGDAMSGDLRPYDGPGTIYNPMYFNGITSHDVRLGMRWRFDQPMMAPIYAPPVISKG
jgi:opacity protein-like surface antigen